MKALADWLERALTAFVTRVPGRVVALTAFVCYPILGLVLPLALGWSTTWSISANVVGVSAAAIVSMSWLTAQLQAKDRRQLLEWTTDMRHLSAEEFEWLVGEMFRREGWSVEETGSQSRPDGNIDLELSRGNEHVVVQCKRWQAREIPVDEIRKFGGTLLGPDGANRRGTFVTLSRFNEHAQAEAQRSGITLIDGADLYRRIEAVKRAEPCPACQQPMLLDRSSHGWWFRCVAANCSGKKDLGRDPALAVELLTHNPQLSAGPR